MSGTNNAKTEVSIGPDARVMARVIEESYGPGAWHGPDLKAALADVETELAFWRPSPQRHNIAEIALHHAYHTHAVRGKLTGSTPEPFLLAGEDWFALPVATGLSWSEIRTTVDTEQRRFSSAVASLGAGEARSPLSGVQFFDLVLGIAFHAVYHAGQIQLIKRLHAG